MTIAVGDTLPDADLLIFGEEGPGSVALSSLTKGRKVIIFGLPGAFTRTCDAAHVPSFIRTKDAFAAKGVDDIICFAVNDPFVMAAWGKSSGAAEAGIHMLADADGGLTKALGMDFDAPPVGFHGRCKRFALLAEDGVVKVLQMDENPGTCELSGGEAMLDAI
ncbi:peroxiredoxin [Meridianimarinicoccus roseus]|jgi:cytochrome c peroxidase|uniref:Glutathione-dependent peroxiredoxin n=1 Tax=Meridianimarinicoccus roseus TaxID=2072018 RepID=A0A2V2LBV3_9RHOB|nr:peroxiredoxin [Meridianimarinicoccus roseus]PWR02775.1 peroxiredoxin [Meridianimarinicoccus roseus]